MCSLRKFSIFSRKVARWITVRYFSKGTNFLSTTLAISQPWGVRKGWLTLPTSNENTRSYTRSETRSKA